MRSRIADLSFSPGFVAAQAMWTRIRATLVLLSSRMKPRERLARVRWIVAGRVRCLRRQMLSGGPWSRRDPI